MDSLEKLRKSLKTTIVMLSVSTRNKWNALTDRQRKQVIDIIWKHQQRCNYDHIDESWYLNAMSDVTGNW